MEKGQAASAPPIQPYPTGNVMQGGMPAAPPSYSDAVGGGHAGGFAAPPSQPPQGGQPMYPPLPPQQKGVPVLPPQQQPVRIQQTIQYVQAPSFGHRPLQIVCPHCQASITTKTVSEPSALAWILGGVLCLTGLWVCACIPCCIDSLQQVTHSCPNCKNFLGRYKGGL